VVHRDIKPSNVLLRKDGSYALIDFGSVRDRMKPEGGSTVVGTFGFMAPEQFQGRAMPASDVYAVGATALAMLTGREPEDLPHKGLAIDVKAALGSAASPAMVSALSAMLEPDPDKRAGRIAPLLARFDAPAPSPPFSPPRAGPPAAPPPPPSKRDRKREEREREKAREEAKRNAKEARKEAKRDEKHARKGPERGPWQDWDSWEQGAKWRRRRLSEPPFAKDAERPLIPGPFLFIIMFGLTLAQIAVTLALRTAIPIAFTILSVIFGKSWREAARTVSNAGKIAVDSIENAKGVVSGRPVPKAREAGAPEVRVNVPEEERRARVDTGAPAERKARSGPPSGDEQAEIEAQAEREAEREAAEQRRARRRRT
jgi:hypothetical protein